MPKWQLWHRLWHRLTTRWHGKGHFWADWQNRVEMHLVRKVAKVTIRTRPQSKPLKVVNFDVFMTFRCFVHGVCSTEVLTCLRHLKHAEFGVFTCFINILDYWPKPRSGNGSFRPFKHMKTQKTPLLDTVNQHPTAKRISHVWHWPLEYSQNCQKCQKSAEMTQNCQKCQKCSKTVSHLKQNTVSLIQVLTKPCFWPVESSKPCY